MSLQLKRNELMKTYLWVGFQLRNKMSLIQNGSVASQTTNRTNK